MSKKWIEAATEEMVKGNTSHARRLLRAYIERYPDDEEGWYWLSRVADNRAEEVECLKRQWELRAARKHSLPANLQVANTQSSQPQPSTLRQVVQLAAYSLVVTLICVMAAAVVPMFWGNRTIVITSGSMEPALQAGSAVVVESTPSNKLQVGDVIAYSPDSNTIPVVHRIVAIREEDGVRYYTTQGDANHSPDANEFTLPQNAWRMWYAIPLAGYLIAFVGQPAGTFVLVFLPVLALVTLKAIEAMKRGRATRSSPIETVKQF